MSKTKTKRKKLHPAVIEWLREKQSKGGSARTPAKVEAARKNGLKAPQVLNARLQEADPD